MRWPPLVALRRFAARLRPHATILMYHRVASEARDPWGLCVRPEHFAEHMEVLARRTEVVPLSRLPAAIDRRRPGRPLVAITFDDGYSDNLHAAKPVLERCGLPATVFIASAWIGRERPFWWDELQTILLETEALPGALELAVDGGGFVWRVDRRPRPALYRALWRRLWPLADELQQEALERLAVWAGVTRPAAGGRRALRPAEVVRLAEGGLIEIGAHTATHPPLRALPPETRMREVRAGKAACEAMLGRPVDSFSYPYGQHDARTRAIVREAGFARGCTSDGTVVARRRDPLALPRITVADCDGDRFERGLARGWPT